MARQTPNRPQNFLSSVILPFLSLALLPVSILAVIGCLVNDRVFRWSGVNEGLGEETGKGGGRGSDGEGRGEEKGCVIISGGRMSKGLTLARAFKRAGWKVIGVEDEGWGELCPLRFSSSISAFHLLPPPSKSFTSYSSTLLSIALQHSATLFIPVSGAGSSLEDAQAASDLYTHTNGKCRTFIQDYETMLDLHDKDRFINLVDRLGMRVPKGRMVRSVEEGLAFLREEADGQGGVGRPRFIIKCMGLDENRGDMTLFPLKVDCVGGKGELRETERALRGLKLGISKDCPYVFQEFIPGQEYCTHASVIDSRLTSFVTCPSNDMLMTYENITSTPIGHLAEQWTTTFLSALSSDPTETGKKRSLTGHFSFDFIQSTIDGELYPLECNARVHTAVIMLPLSEIASCYSQNPIRRTPLKPLEGTLPRSWLYNDLIMRYLPYFVDDEKWLRKIHPSLPACVHEKEGKVLQPSEGVWEVRVDPTLVADDWRAFLVLWHVWWPYMVLKRWWQGKKWTRINVSTGRIFEAE